MKYLSEAYPRDEWSPDRIQLWIQQVADLDFDSAKDAVVFWVSTEKWPPSVAEIRDRALVNWRQRYPRTPQLSAVPEPVEITPEQREANLKVVREFIGALKRDPGYAMTLGEWMAFQNKPAASE